jgi:hypothetical protein
VQWEAEKMPAGIYLCLLRAEGVEQGVAGKIVKY